MMPNTTEKMNGHAVATTFRDVNCEQALQPCISHIDFWPTSDTKVLRACDASFESFCTLVERANKWLNQFPECSLISIETADKKVIDLRDIYSSSTYFTDAEDPVLATHIKGLRLWYRAPTSAGPRKAPTQIDFIDTVPRYLNPGDKHPKFDTLPATIEKINRRLSENPIPGRVLSVETVVLKIAQDDWSGPMHIDTCRSCWYDEYNTHQLAFIRIFYEKGIAVRECIGIHDFLPDTLSEAGVIQPAKYSSFSSLVRKAAAWLLKNSAFRITNLQTLDTKHRKKSENKGCRFNTDKLFEFRIEDRFRAVFLRVGYVHSLEVQPQLDSLPECLLRLSFREYLPIKKETGYENITELLQRLDDLVRRKDSKVVHVETVALPEWITAPASRHAIGPREDRSFFDGEWYFVPDADGNDRGPYRYTLIYILRVYFDGLTDSAFSRMRSISLSNTGNKCCMLL